MPIPPWLRRAVRTTLETYELRLSAALVASVGLIAVLVNLPVLVPEPRVGWGYPPNHDPIPLSAVQPLEEEPERNESARPAPETAPQPTRHASGADALPSGNAESSGTDAGRGAPPPPPSSNESAHEPLQMARLAQDERPELVGGKGALYLNIRYPDRARREGIEGQLILGFTVTPDGDARDILVLKSLHPACDSAAVDAVRTAKFVPGKQNGDPVPVRMRLPIRFRLLPSLKASSASG